MESPPPSFSILILGARIICMEHLSGICGTDVLYCPSWGSDTAAVSKSISTPVSGSKQAMRTHVDAPRWQWLLQLR